MSQNIELFLKKCILILEKFVKSMKNIFLKIFIKMKCFYIIYERIQESNFHIKEYFRKIK